jgi:aldehyde:ferredoxin oxidoreductase
MKGGYIGKLLRVNLTEQICSVENLEAQEETLEKFIGGVGLSARYLFEETTSRTDPLGPDNKLILMTGPFCGTPVPTSGRHAVVARSPLTGIYGESDCGGNWGAMLKKTGFDGIIFEGQSKNPVYLWVNDGKTEIRDASHLWGLDTYDLDEIIKNETHGKAVVASIGQAGERLVRFGSIMTDGNDGRAAGRTGMGAVMGSKKLKAIAVQGRGEVNIIDRKALTDSIREIIPNVMKRTEGLRQYGTSGGVAQIEKLGDLPIKNWRLGSWEAVEKISGIRLADTILTGRFHCGACPIGCGRIVEIKEGKYAPVKGAGPEYETVAALGSLLLVEDLEAICKANELCNRYGIDTMSTGGVIAFAFEAFERGILPRELTSDLNLSWGDPDAMLRLIHLIGKREGIGDLLAEGVKRAAEKLGHFSQEFAIHTKGLEPSLHDPRAHNGLAVLYATSSIGASHSQGQTHNFEKVLTCPEMGITEPHDRFAVEGKGELVAKTQDLMCLFDSLKLCKFTLFGGISLTYIHQWLKSITGWDLSLNELIKAGERISNLKRLYNIRLGLSRKDDLLHPRLLTHRRGTGGSAENLPHLGKMLSEYYAFRGWDEEGIPRIEKLRELGLERYALTSAQK